MIANQRLAEIEGWIYNPGTNIARAHAFVKELFYENEHLRTQVKNGRLDCDMMLTAAKFVQMENEKLKARIELDSIETP